jgi:hypothetical protein
MRGCCSFIATALRFQPDSAGLQNNLAKMKAIAARRADSPAPAPRGETRAGRRNSFRDLSTGPNPMLVGQNNRCRPRR